MSFDSGTVSFRIFHLRQSLTRSSIEKFAAMAVPPIEMLAREPIQGWSSWRHLLDRKIEEDSCFFGAWLHLALMRAERKIPAALLRAHCRMEEDVEMRARQVDFLPRKARAEIKERVVEELLPTMPPTLAGIGMVADLRYDRVYAEALSDAQVDRFGPFFRETTGQMPLLLTAESLALREYQVNANDLQPSSFSADESVEDDFEISLGLEFLTWLWYNWEREGGIFKVANGDRYGYMLEGPLLFFRQGEGAHEAVLRKGSPLQSREAGMALYCGKKLKRAKITMTQDGEKTWVATIDADFSFRSLKQPQGDQTDPIGRFQERMSALDTFVSAYFALYDMFLQVRRDPAAWQLCLADMRSWVGNLAQL